MTKLAEHLSTPKETKELQSSRILEWQDMTVPGAIAFIEQAIVATLSEHPNLSPTQALITTSRSLPRIRGFVDTLLSELLQPTDASADPLENEAAEKQVNRARQACVLVYAKAIIAAIDRFSIDTEIDDDFFMDIVTKVIEGLQQNPPPKTDIPTRYLNTKAQYALQQFYSQKYDVPAYLITVPLARKFQEFEKEILNYGNSLTSEELDNMLADIAQDDNILRSQLIAIGKKLLGQPHSLAEAQSVPHEGERRLFARAFWNTFRNIFIGDELGPRNIELYLQYFNLVQALENLGFEAEMEDIESLELADITGLAAHHHMSTMRVRQVISRLTNILSKRSRQLSAHRPRSYSPASHTLQTNREEFQMMRHSRIERERQRHAPYIRGSYEKDKLYEKMLLNADIAERIEAIKVATNRPTRLPVSKKNNPYFSS